MKIWIIILLALAYQTFIVEASVPPICDIYNLSWTLCNTEINCVKHMFLDENIGDNVTFNFLVNRVITNYHVVDYIDDLICNSTEGQALWMVILKDFNYCNHMNEYYSAHLQKCVCRTDKVCDHASEKKHLFIFSEIQVFIWALLVLLTLLFIPSIQQISALWSMTRDLTKLTNGSG